MGQFSWMFADRNNEKPLHEGRKAYVPCPDGTVLIEECYDGYGHFSGHDIYDLVADWNKEHISVDLIQKPNRNMYRKGKEYDKYFDEGMKRYQKAYERLSDFINHRPAEEMVKIYGEDWKREIGIDIACRDEDNANLTYPIKVCKHYPNRYDLLPASISDPNQGWY